MVMLPFRAAPGLAATSYVRKPLPEPELGPENEMKPPLGVAFQLQLPEVCICIASRPPRAVKPADKGVSATSHPPSFKANASASPPMALPRNSAENVLPAT